MANTSPKPASAIKSQLLLDGTTVVGTVAGGVGLGVGNIGLPESNPAPGAVDALVSVVAGSVVSGTATGVPVGVA